MGIRYLRTIFFALASFISIAMAFPAVADEDNKTLTEIVNSETANPTLFSKETLENIQKLLRHETLKEYVYAGIAGNLLYGAKQEGDRGNYRSSEQKARLVIDYIDLYAEKFVVDGDTLANKGEANLLLWFYSGDKSYQDKAIKQFLDAEAITTSTTVAKNLFASVNGLNRDEKIEVIQRVMAKKDLVTSSVSHAADQQISTYGHLLWYGKQQGRSNQDLLSIAREGIQVYHQAVGRLPVHVLNSSLAGLLANAEKTIGEKADAAFAIEWSDLVKQYGEEEKRLNAWKIFKILAENERYDEATYWLRLAAQNGRDMILVKQRKYINQKKYDDVCSDGINSPAYQKVPAFVKYAEKFPDEFKKYHDSGCSAILEVLADRGIGK